MEQKNISHSTKAKKSLAFHVARPYIFLIFCVQCNEQHRVLGAYTCTQGKGQIKLKGCYHMMLYTHTHEFLSLLICISCLPSQLSIHACMVHTHLLWYIWTGIRILCSTARAIVTADMQIHVYLSVIIITKTVVLQRIHIRIIGIYIYTGTNLHYKRGAQKPSQEKFLAIVLSIFTICAPSNQCKLNHPHQSKLGTMQKYSKK